MISKFKVVIIFISVAVLGGCALVPESVKLNPTINVPHSHIGKGQVVAVNVIDARPATALGGRASGYGPAAKISLATSLVSTVKATVERGLIANGFKIAAPAQSAASNLTIRIIALQYKSRAGFFTGHIDISSTLEGSAKNQSRTYDKVYRYNSSNDAFFTPTAGRDSKNINAALSVTINKLLADKSLMSFLAKPVLAKHK